MSNKPEKYKHFFDTKHIEKDLKGKSIRGGAWTISGQLSSYLIKMISTIVLARILTPADYGLVAMIIVIINFFLMFKDMGLSMATIQRAEITHEQVSSLFWFNLLASIIIGVVIALISPLVVKFYNEPRLLKIILVLSILFPASGLIIQHQAILERRLMFRQLFIIQSFSVFLGITVGLILATNGFGYWSLVLMQISEPIAMIPMVYFFCRWRPSTPRYNSEIFSMLAFGANITGFNIANYFSRNLDKILIGKYYSVADLGNYSKAYSLSMLPVNQIRVPIQKVSLPVLSRLQNDTSKYNTYYCRLINILSFITMPLMIFLALCSNDIVRILLGEQWLGMVGIFKILAVASFIQPVASTRGIVFISLGQSQKFLKWGVAYAIILTISFIIGIRWGVYGVAFSYCLANYLSLIPSLWYCFSESPISLFDFLKNISGPVVASLISGSLIFFFYQNRLIPGDFLLFRISLNFFVFALVYLAVLSVNPYWKRDLYSIIKLLNNIRK